MLQSKIVYMNKRIVYLVCSFLCVSLSFSLFGQTTNSLNMAKYWNYRYNLIGDDIDPNYTDWEPGFLDLTLAQGGSLPAVSQILTTDASTSKDDIYRPYVGQRHFLGSSLN